MFLVRRRNCALAGSGRWRRAGFVSISEPAAVGWPGMTDSASRRLKPVYPVGFRSLFAVCNCSTTPTPACRVLPRAAVGGVERAREMRGRAAPVGGAGLCSFSRNPSPVQVGLRPAARWGGFLETNELDPGGVRGM